MVNSTNTSNARKRKKSADMPDSPPKRVTRARAKATEDTEIGMKTAKILTASAKAALAHKTPSKPAKPAKAPKRKTKAEEVKEAKEAKEAVAQSKMASDNTPTEPSKPRARAKKISEATLETNLATSNELPRTRSRADVTSKPAFETTAPTLPKTRGRPRKVAETPAEESQETENEAVVVEPVKKVTRGGQGVVAISGISKASVTKPLATKKKVTFREELEQNKENIDLNSIKGKEVSQAPLSGLRAKPIRKPPVPRASTRGKQATKRNKEEPAKELKQNKVLPLSPKKIDQLAKSLSSNESDDELCGDRTPCRALNKSPVKAPPSPSHALLLSPLKTSSPLNGKEDDNIVALSIFGSPIRRPPPSPFKDALKESPKRIQFDVNSGPLLLPPSRLPFKDSLQESPRRIRFDASSGPLIFPTKSPLKGSLLQSPARRLGLGSPTRTIAPGTPGKADTTLPLISAASTSKPFKSILSQTTRVPDSIIREVESVAIRTTTDDTMIHKDEVEDPLLGKETTPIKAPQIEDLVASPTQTESIPVGKSIKESPQSNLDNFPSNNPTVEMEQAREVPETIEGSEQSQSIPPSTKDTNITPNFATGPTPVNPFSGAHFAPRELIEDTDSEDELQSPQKIDSMSNLRRNATDTPASIEHYKPLRRTSVVTTAKRGYGNAADEISMTPLATQLSSWLASSPDKKRTAKGNRLRSIFSPAITPVQEKRDRRVSFLPSGTPVNSTFFDDEIAVLEQEHEFGLDRQEEDQLNNIDLHANHDSQGSQEYGDENVIPLDPQLLQSKEDVGESSKVCTPVRTVFSNPREIHTVSKVPLRAADDTSPLKVFRKRSRSLSGPQLVFSELKSRESHTAISDIQEPNQITGLPKDSARFPSDVQDVDWESNRGPSTRKPSSPLSTYTPAKTERKGADAEILRGAVVYVDVHTTEGADASGIFVELLIQMGARCVKQWNWNPRASIGHNVDHAQPNQDQSVESSVPNGKVGITHVVFKDGGRRTLEKVNESNGQVFCVGVGWVLEWVLPSSLKQSQPINLHDSCEQQNKWLSEAEYAVDTSVIPRGGSRRRKSMEPKMLANLNGNLVPAETPSKPETNLSPTKEFLNLSSPAFLEPDAVGYLPAPMTPAANIQHFEGESTWGSPTTPYYLSKGAQLVQQTCPPKQTLKPLFPVSGLIEDQPDENVRQRLLLARRKSLQWAPKISSPLGRGMSFGS